MRANICFRTWLALTLAGVAPCVHAATLSYNNVADTTTTAPGQGTFTGFGTIPAVSGNNVTFQANYSGGVGIYTGSVSATGAAKIVDRTDTAPGQGLFTALNNAPSVSGSNVAFHGTYSGGVGIYTGSVGLTGAAKIVDRTDTAPGHGLFTTFYNPSISGSNLVFKGEYTGGNGVYTGNVGATGAAKIVDSTDTAPGHGPFTVLGDLPTVSGNTVAFMAGYSGGIGVYTGTVGVAGAVKVVDTTDTAPGHGTFNNLGFPSISGNKLAFWGSYAGGGQGIYTGSVGATGAAEVVDVGDIAPGHGAFTSLDQTPAASGSDVAFIGFYSGGHGIYLASGGAGGTLSPVLNTGDALFGSTVTTLVLGRSGFDSGVITFGYDLANGRNGVGVVSGVPEPASLSAPLALATLTLLRKRCREGLG